MDLLTQSAAKKLALAAGGGDLPTPILTDEDFLAQAGALLASANNSTYLFIYLFIFVYLFIIIWAYVCVILFGE